MAVARLLGKQPGPAQAAVVIGSSPNSLGAVRSLAAAGIRTIAVALDPDDPLLLSRFGEKVLLLSEDDLCNGLLEMAAKKRLSKAVLIPTADNLVDCLNQDRDRLSQTFQLAIAGPDELTCLLDKAYETQAVHRLGIPVPETLYPLPDKPEEVGQRLRFPVILKPRTFQAKKRLGRKNVVVAGMEDLREAFRQYAACLDGLLAQECVPGDDDTLWVCDCVFDSKSELISAFTFKKLRTAPAHHGVASMAVSEYNADLIELSRQVGKGLNYVGPADLDFKYDARDGKFKYLELNARLGMCNGFATRCGVNCALDTYNLVTGTDGCRAASLQTNGVYYLNLHDDLYSRLFDGEGLLSILRSYGHVLLNRCTGPYSAWNDWRPGVYMFLRNFGGALAHRLARALRLS